MRRFTILVDDEGRVQIEGASATDVEYVFGRFGLQAIESFNCGRPRQGTAAELQPRREARPGERTARVAKIYYSAYAEGPGARNVVQFQGCSIRCPGCYVPQTHDPTGGVEMTIDEIADRLLERPCDGVTILGGEPFDQPAALYDLVTQLRMRDGWKPHIVCYTGYKWEQLRADPKMRPILGMLEILVDGPYIQALAAAAGEWRGSRNQRIIKLPGIKPLPKYPR